MKVLGFICADIAIGYAMIWMVNIYKSIGLVSEAIRFTIMDAFVSLLVVEAVAYTIYRIVKNHKKYKF